MIVKEIIKVEKIEKIKDQKVKKIWNLKQEVLDQ